jgi:hypothetical protein
MSCQVNQRCPKAAMIYSIKNKSAPLYSKTSRSNRRTSQQVAGFFVGKEIYITGKSAACPPIKELRQVKGNDVHSTEPRSGEGSPLDWLAGCKPRGSINFRSNEKPR